MLHNPDTLDVVVQLAKSEDQLDMELLLRGVVTDQPTEIGIVGADAEKNQFAEMMQEIKNVI